MAGEHIRTRKDGRWTHAIDCGDETVIHLVEEAGRIQRSYRPEFVARAEAVEIVTHRERTFPAGEIVARAYSRIADPALAAMFRDSEAFAEWCATGRLPPGPANVAIAISDAAPEPPPPARALEPVQARASAPPTGRRGSARKAPRRKKARPAVKRRAAPKRTGKRAAAAGRRKPAKRASKPGRSRRR